MSPICYEFKLIKLLKMRTLFDFKSNVSVHIISSCFLVLINCLLRNIDFEGKSRFSSKLQTLSFELDASNKSSNNHRYIITIHKQKSFSLFFNLFVFISVSIYPSSNLESRTFLPISRTALLVAKEWREITNITIVKGRKVN